MFRVEALEAGRAALRVAGRATVFAAFERCCYVEANGGIACLGADIGLGPLSMIVEDFKASPVGTAIDIDVSSSKLWKPPAATIIGDIPEREIPESIRTQAETFLNWISGSGRPDDSLIGRGPGLTPAGDDFVGGAMIALRVCGTNAGHAALADRIAAWALPLAARNTNRISRAHLECAATGEGHEALHDLLCSFDEKHLERLSRIGHSSGLDAAAGALLALQAACAAVNPPSRRNPSRSWSTSPAR